MRTFFTLSPPAAARLARFRRNRVAVGSLLLLTLLYAMGLGADLLCNDKPLYLRYEGRSAWPFLGSRPPQGVPTAPGSHLPDYRALAASATFRADPRNRIVFAPFPCSPHEVTDPRTLADQAPVRLTLAPAAVAGRFNLKPDGTIIRAEGCDDFFDRPNPDGLSFTNLWLLTPEAEAALAARLAGRAAPAFSGTIARRANPARQALMRLTETAPRAAPPTSVRVALANPEIDTAGWSIDFHRRDARPTTSAAVWQKLTPTEQQALLSLVEQALGTDEPVATALPWRGGSAQATARRLAVSWPFPPAPGHRMGIDAAGRDVLARIVHGMRTSLTFGILLTAWAMFVGLAIGALQGFFGGWIDLLAQRFIEIWSALPFLYVMILVGAVLGRSFLLLLVCYGIFNWIGLSYYMRAEFLRLRNRPFVEAARCQGLGTARIIFRHILPNALTPLITLFPFSLVGAVASLAALDFLGFGLPPLTPSWGELLQQAQQYRWAWWLILYPSLALFTVMLLTVLVGEGIRQAYDPKPYSKME